MTAPKAANIDYELHLLNSSDLGKIETRSMTW